MKGRARVIGFIFTGERPGKAKYFVHMRLDRSDKYAGANLLVKIAVSSFSLMVNGNTLRAGLRAVPFIAVHVLYTRCITR